MSPEKAMKILCITPFITSNSDQGEEFSDEVREAIDTAIDALRTVSNDICPVEAVVDEANNICPACHNELLINGVNEHLIKCGYIDIARFMKSKYKYCPSCGRRIQWVDDKLKLN